MVVFGPNTIGLVMTEDEARERAIALGALEPQGFFESICANWIGNVYKQRWADTPQARKRLKLWTQAVLEGRNPKKSVG
jgi:hypothetical protein